MTMVEKIILQPNTEYVVRDGSTETTVIEIDADGAISFPTFPVVFDSFNIADDAVYALDLGGSVFAGQFMVSTNTEGVGSGSYSFRAASSGNYVDEISSEGNIAAVNDTVLTGTSGTDGFITLSSKDSTLYIENRSGSTWLFGVTRFHTRP